MHVRFEPIQRPNSFSDSIITSLSWMRNNTSANAASNNHNNNNNNSSSSATNNNNNNNANPGSNDLIAAQQHHELPNIVPDLNNNYENFPNNNYIPNNNNNNNNNNSNNNNNPFVQHYHTHSNINDNNNHSSGNHRESSNSNHSTAQETGNQTNAQQAKEGWLAVGNAHGVVGVSFTSTRSYDYCFGDCDDDPLEPANYANGDWRRPLPGRTNYNLRGHRAEITLVRWNEPFQKLATCDESGVIFIWIKYEGRWSVELINDRSARVTDMAWSSDGRLAVICYVDGFVLVGSVTGQRYWSSMLNLNEGHVTCCVWSGDDQNILFSTSSGHVLVISAHGQYITQVSVQACVSICGLAWAWPLDHTGARSSDWNCGRGSSLAVAFNDGVICLLNNYDDPMPEMIRTELTGLRMCWSSTGQVLAVGGHRTRTVGSTRGTMVLFKTTYVRYEYMNVVQLYSRSGNLQCRIKLDYDQASLTTLVWGNDDTRLYVACGKLLLVGWVSHQVPTLAHLARVKAHQLILKRQQRPKRLLLNLELPWPVRGSIHEVLTPTICCHLPDYSRIREFVFRPPPHNIRLYCTLIRHSTPAPDSSKSVRPSSSTANSRSATPISSLADDESIYVLYLEYLGGLVPILKGKRSSKLKTEFVIYDPVNSVDGERIDIHNHDFESTESTTGSRVISLSATSDEDNDHSEDEDHNSDRTSGFAFSFLTPKTRRRLLHLRSAQIRRFFRNDPTDNERSTGSATPVRRRMHRLSRGLANFDDDDDDSDSADESFRSTYMQRFYRPNSAQRLSQFDSRQNFSGKKSSIQQANKTVKRPLKIVMVRSNIWGTKFKFLSVTPMLPSRLGSMNYRTSFLHLQPRQMALTIKEMHAQNTSLQPPSGSDSPTKVPADGAFYSSMTSDSEDTSDSEFSLCDADLNNEQPTPAIVPISPPKCVRNSMLLSFPANANPILPNRQNSVSGSSVAEMPPINRQTVQAAEEFLTLAIAEPSTPGNSLQYSMEISSSRSANSRQEPPEVVAKSNENSPKQQLCQSVPSSSMVRQFKHQTFHSESPKHVRKQREPSTTCPKKSRTSEHSHICDAATRPFCTEIRTKILKESPSRKASSIVACSSGDFSPTKPTAAYKPEPEVESVVKVPISALGEMKTVCQMFDETCTLVAHAGSTTTTTTTTGNTAGVTPLATAGTTIPSSTSLILESDAEESRTAQIRRRQFQQQSSKSFDQQAPSNDMDCVCDPLSLSNQSNSPQIHLNNIEHAVKVLSEKLQSATLERNHTENVNASLIGQQQHPNEHDHHHHHQQQQQQHQQPTSVRRRSSSLEASSLVMPISVNSPSDINNQATPVVQTSQPRKSLGLHLFKSPVLVRKLMRRKLSYLDCTSTLDLDSNENEVGFEIKQPNQTTATKIDNKNKALSSDKCSISTPNSTKTTPLLRRKRSKSRVEPEETKPSRSFHLHNKAPMWNEITQVYQLDFGGRVTQESAKNFQIEHNGKQVMQFGRIDKNAYTLDFEYPFSAIQALSVALANVTQRFK